MRAVIVRCGVPRLAESEIACVARSEEQSARLTPWDIGDVFGEVSLRWLVRNTVNQIVSVFLNVKNIYR
jgi:hypothetical protein